MFQTPPPTMEVSACSDTGLCCIQFSLGPINVFSEVDVETSVRIMQSQSSAEGRTTDVASDHKPDHITWLTERVPVNEEAYEKL